MRRLAAAAAALMLTGAPAVAQYFGQNKVQYRHFDWQIIQTDHFDTYYYEGERAAALDAARMAERAYGRLSRVLHHQFRGRKPIILYASHSDFQQTNALPGAVPEGTQGVTEFFKHRMVLPFTGSYADFEHVLMHEMVHQFQYDVFSRGRPGAGIQTIVSVNPPGWFMEGMAEYLSTGPIDPHTAMWLRDAALEGRLPTIEELTYNPTIFPYRFGHAIFSYIGERWGDEVIGEILQATVSGGIPAAVRRATGLTLEQLSDDWRDAVQTTYLPQLADHYRARRIAQPVLTERRTKGRYNLAPALTPDGRQIAFFSERNDFFVDLWLADAETGRVKRRLVRSALSTDFESLRFIFSSGSFSPDGRAFAIAVKRRDRDDLVILDVARGKQERRIEVPLSAIQTPSWSPDGGRLVFTGFDGGLSDLFVINRDGSGLRRLTNDRYADLQPVWSPDGKTIAFVTDRGPDTDFESLRFGNMRIALFDLASEAIDLLPRMDEGKNINPAWSPDGKALAFVSDRSGISNLFLCDLTDNEVYQITDLYTGVTGISPLSPAISWARESDRLAFAYYEEGKHQVYVVENPRSLKRGPYRTPDRPPVVASLLQAGSPHAWVAARAMEPTRPLPADSERVSASVYRSPAGFRESAAVPPPPPPPAAGTADTSGTAAGPVSVRALLDSARLALPDTAAFAFRPYRVRYSTDYVARPTVGYQRDNFGRGLYGGTAVSLSDILGDHTLIFAGAVNGRLAEAEALAAYINQRGRLGWAVGGSQEPLYFYARSKYEAVDLPPGAPSDSGTMFTSRIGRLVIRQVFAQAYYPFSRFERLELGVAASNVSTATLEVSDLFDADGFYFGSTNVRTVPGESVNYVQPSVAFVHDKSLFGFVGPFAGSRWRFQYSPTWGDWRFNTTLFDYRRYTWFRPFTLAFRGFLFGRFGRDADQFPIFLGNTELLRGYTAGSFRDNECAGAIEQERCADLDQLIGSKVAVANVELRFPLLYNVTLGFLGVALPPIEAAAFFDVGLAWDEHSIIKGRREPGDDLDRVREPLRSYGAALRMNLLGFLVFRFDYTQPLDRGHRKAYWTVSLGPTF